MASTIAQAARRHQRLHYHKWCHQWRESRHFNCNITYSDVWSNGTNYYGISAGTGCISANPLWVDPVNGDFTLDASSPCKGAASDGGDMGYRGVSYAPGNNAAGC